MSVFVPSAGGGGGSWTSYGEWAWVPTDPTTAGQALTGNTVEVCTLDTEVADYDSIGSLSSNRLTLGAGVYDYHISIPLINGGATNIAGMCSLYNYTDSSYISRGNLASITALYTVAVLTHFGSFELSGSKALEIRILTISSSGTNYINNAIYNANFTNNTAGAAQRTTIKVWKQ